MTTKDIITLVVTLFALFNVGYGISYWYRVKIARLKETHKQEKLETARIWFGLGWESAEENPLYSDHERFFSEIWKKDEK